MAKNAAGYDYLADERQVKDALNSRLDQISDSVRGITSISAAGTGDKTLLVTDADPEARKPVLVFTGLLTGARNILIPTNEALRIFIVVNNTTGAHALTVKTTAVGSVGVEVTQGETAMLFHDGTDVYGISENSAVVPSVHAYNTSAQSIPNNVETPLDLPLELYDTDVMHDLVTNNSRLTCKTAGNYEVSGGCSLAASATGERYLVVKVNGVAKWYDTRNSVGGGLGSTININYKLPLAVNDYVQLFVSQNSGGALNSTSAYLAMEKIG